MNSYEITITKDTDANLILAPMPYSCSDVLTAAIVSLWQGSAKVLFTNDESKVKGSSVISCIGTKYDGVNHFSHHGFNLSMHLLNECRPNGIHYSSAGLLWQVHGVEICEQIASCPTGTARKIANDVDQSIMQPADAYVNSELPMLNIATFGEILEMTNPTWIEPSSTDAEVAFIRASDFARYAIERFILTNYAESCARNEVDRSIRTSDGQVMVLDTYFQKWLEYFFVSEEPRKDSMLYCVYEQPPGRWVVEPIPRSLNRLHRFRRPFPDSWHSQKRTNLKKIVGFPATCHSDGAFCTTNNFRTAMQLAHLAAGN